MRFACAAHIKARLHRCTTRLLSYVALSQVALPFANQVRLGGFAEDTTKVHVGSPMYITEVCSQVIGSKYIERGLLSSDGDVTAADDQEADVLSVSSISLRC